MTVRVKDIANALERRFPVERAEDWDRVGLLAGDPEEPVTGVVLALDPTVSAVEAAHEAGANVLVSHHPAFLTPPAYLRPGGGPGGVLFAAVSNGIALVSAHTNLDRDQAAQRLLPDILGLEPIAPLETTLKPLAVVTVYTPADAEDAVTEAMRWAGAGRIGEYEGCSFAGDGTGSFTPSPSSFPTVGAPGEPSRSSERRIEMVCPRGRAEAVVSAAVTAHPYEEPLVTVTEVVIARNAARLGMTCAVPGAPVTLAALASRCAASFDSVPRVWGYREREVRRVATTTGSGSFLLAAARAAEVDALIVGEVRYHDALDAAESGLALIELGHDVSEWPLVSLLAQTVLEVPGIEAADVHVLPSRAGWWTPSEGNR